MKRAGSVLALFSHSLIAVLFCLYEKAGKKAKTPSHINTEKHL